MALSDCPKCWDTPCACGYMGSDRQAMDEIEVRHRSDMASLQKRFEEAAQACRSYVTQIHRLRQGRKNLFIQLKDALDRNRHLCDGGSAYSVSDEQLRAAMEEVGLIIEDGK